MSSRKCLYAGTFDPPTNGHRWMIAEAAELFDKVIVAVAVNPEKRPLFSLEERQAMLRDLCEPWANVRVDLFPKGAFLINEAERLGARFVLRGLRKASDFDYEYGIRQINEDVNPRVLSVFLMPPRHLGEVSSSFVKGLVGLEGWVPNALRYAPRPVVDRLLERHLHRRWDSLCQRGGVEAGACDALFTDLVGRYREPQRRYHTLAHLEQMLEEHQRERSHLEHPDLVELALWYHDSVYDPAAAGNEAASAALARDVAGRGFHLSEENADWIDRAIRATAHADGGEVDRDTAFLLDMDLSILGQKPEIYDAYEASIWEEYQPFVERARFCRKRGELLRSFLDRAFLFRTEEFRERYEARARANLRRAVAQLGRG